MNVALLGSDPVLLDLARVLFQTGNHRIKWAFRAGRLEGELTSIVPDLEPLEAWEQLAGETGADAVIVASESPVDRPEGRERSLPRDEIVRRLAQAGKHLLLVDPETLGLMTMYELAMIQQETGHVVMPIRYEPLHPAFVSFGTADPLRESKPIRHLVFQRSVPTQPHLEADEILHAYLARDVFLLRHFIEDVSRVNTLASPRPVEIALLPEPDASGSPGPVSLCVSLANDRGIVATWTAIPTEQNRSAVELTILGERETSTWQWTDLKSGMSRQTLLDENGEPTRFGPWDPAKDLLERFFHATENQQPAAELAEATRSLELVDAVVRSMRRHRAIELQKEAQTESGAFKGTMASVGCGLLGFVLIALILTAAAEGMGFPQVYYAWYGIVPLLVLFLGLQFLGLLSRSAEGHTNEKNG